jgi:hypothetical protein
LGENTFGGKMLEGTKKEAHAVRCLGENTFRGKMKEGLKKEEHIQAGLARGASKSGKMEEGTKKEEHIQAGQARGASKSGKMEPGEKLKAHLEAIFDGKMAARRKLLHQLSITKGGQWRIVAARPTKDGKMKHDETAKVGDKLKSNYSWCFYNGDDTFTKKRVNKMLKK